MMLQSARTDLGRRLAVQADHDAAHVLIAMLHVKVDLVRDLGALRSFGGLSKVDKSQGTDQHQAGEDLLEVGHVEDTHAMNYCKSEEVGKDVERSEGGQVEVEGSCKIRVPQ